MLTFYLGLFPFKDGLGVLQSHQVPEEITDLCVNFIFIQHLLINIFFIFKTFGTIVVLIKTIVSQAYA